MDIVIHNCTFLLRISLFVRRHHTFRYTYREVNHPQFLFFWYCDNFDTFNGLKSFELNQFKEYK